MPRQKRVDAARGVYHALNRGNRRQTIFPKHDDYEAFLRVLEEGREKDPVEFYAYVLMPKHGHRVLRPAENGRMGQRLRWLTATHPQRDHAHDHIAGKGHLCRAHFKSFPIEDNLHVLVVGRYVARNPVRVRLVIRSEAGNPGSLWEWVKGPKADRRLLLA